MFFDPALDAQIVQATLRANLTVSAWVARSADMHLTSDQISDKGLKTLEEFESLYGPLNIEEPETTDIVIDGVIASAAQRDPRPIPANTSTRLQMRPTLVCQMLDLLNSDE